MLHRGLKCNQKASVFSHCLWNLLSAHFLNWTISNTDKNFLTTGSLHGRFDWEIKIWNALEASLIFWSGIKLSSSYLLFCGGRDFIFSMMLIHQQSSTLKQLLKVPKTKAAKQERCNGPHFKMRLHLNLNAVKDIGHYGTWAEKELSVPTKPQRGHLHFLK